MEYDYDAAASHNSYGDETILIDTPSPKKSKRLEGKRMVQVPMVGGDAYPPADTWNWRKYGQKPIKASPYPRGYYRCSTSKGCPARKQVERSIKDPTSIIITYASDHNHLNPATKYSEIATSTTTFPLEEQAIVANQPDFEPDNMNFAQFVADFGYLSKITSVFLESHVATRSTCIEPDARPATVDDDDYLFADLGELPGCALIFSPVNAFSTLHATNVHDS